MSKSHFQVVVVGSGFAGSLIAMISHRLGLSTVLVERGRHPRFMIGESSTPLANLLLEELATEFDLPFVRPLCKWGTWQASTPQLACGLKRGFTFYHHEPGRAFRPDPDRKRQLMVGASPNDQIADTHWYRPDFDHYLVQQAQALGVTYWDGVELTTAGQEPNGMRLSGKRSGRSMEITAELVIDATGPRGFLHRFLGLPEEAFATLPPTQALFSHFTGVGPLPKAFHAIGDKPPYPPEQAAVHHVFPGGWVWVLKFNNGVTSAGVAATDLLANALELKSGAPGWQNLMQRYPSLAEIFGPARPVIPFVHQPRLAFQSGEVAGANWVLLPSAAGVIDPLLSTGFPLTLLGIQRIARVLKTHWRLPTLRAGLQDYARLTTQELVATARLVGALYATMDQFEVFQDLSLLYFAAASFSETARRLGNFQLADAFLLCRNPVFASQCERVCNAVGKPLSPSGLSDLKRVILEAIEPLDVAGLSERCRHPWYPAVPSDILRNSPKVGASAGQVSEMLRRCGLT